MKTTRPILFGLLLLAVPIAVQAQLTFTTNGGAITIAGYLGTPPRALTIPAATNGLPVTSLGIAAFMNCWGLTNATIANGVTSIGHEVFAGCTNLTGVYFSGNAPLVGSAAFAGNATAYYLPGTTGWGTNVDGIPTALWFLPNPLILDLSTSNTSPAFSGTPPGFSARRHGWHSGAGWP